jgi:hypothetical protein
VLTIPPNNGVQDIVCVFEMPAISANGGLGLNRGWAYSLIKQVSFRYGGSSQYFLSGQQLLQAVLRKAPNGSARDDLLALGGQAVVGSALATAQRGYVWLALPHTTPTAEGKLPPLPTDLLTQQVQITIELFPVASVFSSASGATGTAPSSLSTAEFQVQQVIFEDQGNALARRVDMTSHALSYPVEFTQQEVIVPLPSSASGSSQTISLTGFRSGEVKSIEMWLTADSDTSGAVKNPFKWYAPTDITMTYAGEVYARFDKGVGALWNLVNGRISPAVNDISLTDAGGGALANTTASLDQWISLPFAQSYDPVTAHSMYMAGKPITNGIVQVSFTIPPGAPTSTYKVHVSYVYNSVLAFSQGTCDYIF